MIQSSRAFCTEAQLVVVLHMTVVHTGFPVSAPLNRARGLSSVADISTITLAHQ